MTIAISTARPVTVPVRKSNFGGTRAPSAIHQAMALLPIGEGFDYVVSGKDKEGNPQKADIKNQYTHTASSTWAKGDEPKTFKVFEAADQSGLDEFQTRFTIARVEFEKPRAPRTKKAADAAAGEAQGEQSGGDASAE